MSKRIHSLGLGAAAGYQFILPLHLDLNVVFGYVCGLLVFYNESSFDGMEPSEIALGYRF
jgi:hypothetical protein